MRCVPSIVLAALLAAACPAAAPARAAGAFDVPPLDEPPPEAPLPPPPPTLSVAPAKPSVLAPDARNLLEECQEPTFTDCFRLWAPPPPPPPPPVARAPGPPGPLPPDAPREPAKPGALTGGTPPAPDPTADKATYDALVQAIRDAGLEGRILLPEPPADGSATMTLDPAAKKAPPRQ